MFPGPMLSPSISVSNSNELQTKDPDNLDEELISEMEANATTYFIKENMHLFKKTTVEELRPLEKAKLFNKADELLQTERSFLTDPAPTLDLEFSESATDEGSNSIDDEGDDYVEGDQVRLNSG